MSYLPSHLRTAVEAQIESVQQQRLEEWRRREMWRKQLAKAKREQDLRLQAAIAETVRGSS